MSRAGPSRGLRRLGAVWGVAGFVGLILSAVARLLPPAVEALTGPLHAGQWASVVGMTLFMLYSEGYRGFQRQFAPRFASRSRFLREHARAVDVLLAPVFCIGYYHACWPRLLAVWGLTAGIVGLVLLVHRLPAPWRGLVDVAVVCGLAWGLVSTLVCVVRAHRGPPDFDAAQLPAPEWTVSR